jgi:hypothetical protein
MQRRITMIARFKQPSRWSALALLVLIPVGCVSLTSPRTEKPESKQPKPVEAAHKNGISREYVEQLALPGDAQRMTIKVVDAETGAPVAGVWVSLPNFSNGYRAYTTNVTSADGTALFRLPPLDPERAQFNLRANHPDYAERGVTWTSAEGKVKGVLPGEYTVKLERGHTVGGLVVDERGKPVAGVRVEVFGSGYRGYSVGTTYNNKLPVRTASPVSQEFSVISLGTNAPVTDKQGRWSVSHFPTDATTATFGLARPDGSRLEVITHLSLTGEISPNLISYDVLRSRSAVLVLPDGLTVRGVVTDEAGKPLAGVSVVEGGGQGNIRRQAEVKTGRTGRFEFTHRQPREISLTVVADGFATTTKLVEVKAGMGEVKLVLPKARPLRLRVLDEAGAPLAGVGIKPLDYRNDGKVLEWSGRTDREGRVVWPNAPLEAVGYGIQISKGFRRFSASPAGGETVFRLRPALADEIRIEATVTDALTGSPIPSFEVKTNGMFGGGFRKWAVGSGGAFSNGWSRPPLNAGITMPPKLQFAAPGYATCSTPFLSIADGDQALEIKLKPTPAIPGLVRLPNGNPADEAKVWVNEGNGSISSSHPGQFRLGVPGSHLTADRQGRFLLVPPDQDFPMTITHPGGYALRQTREFATSPEVKLQPWGQIKGQLVVDGEPKGGERVYLVPIIYPRKGVTAIRSEETDAAGRFLMDELPAGEYRLFRQPVMQHGPLIVESHQFPVAVESGKTTTVTYALGGRTVTGRLVAELKSGDVNWTNFTHFLSTRVSKPVEPPYGYFLSSESYASAREAYEKSPEQLRFLRDQRNFHLVIRADGSFTADDVPPGTYDLNVPERELREGVLGSTRKLPNSPYGQEPHLKLEVVVPPAAPGREHEPFDLGTRLIKSAYAAGSTGNAPATQPGTKEIAPPVKPEAGRTVPAGKNEVPADAAAVAGRN